MTPIAVVGDGPGGLSAALFLAKNGHEVVVYGDDKTAMHHALLKNYLGVPEVPGSEFQATAIAQVETAGATFQRTRVESIEAVDSGFRVTTEDGERRDVSHVILSEGRSTPLADALGVDRTSSGGIAVDFDFRTSLPGVYAVGRAVRPRRSQAIISAGAGATAAIDILSTMAGEDVQDWDSAAKG